MSTNRTAILVGGDRRFKHDNKILNMRTDYNKKMICYAAAMALVINASASLTVVHRQRDWRFCQKCFVMFYDGGKVGRCATGGVHAAQGYNFALPYDERETSTAQRNWRRCRSCEGMFFAGFPGKGGRCPAGGPHLPISQDYVLPHDVPGTSKAQTEWRFCQKCFVMFYNGYQEKGRCPTGGAHAAAGYGFVLPHSQ